MDGQQRSEFRIRLNEEDASESLLLNEMVNQRFVKLSHRITLTTFLIPVLLAIVLFFGYMDIKKRIGTYEHSGSRGVETLSQDLESRFSSLSVKMATLEADFTARLSIAQKATQTIQTTLDQTDISLNKALKTLAAAKVDKTELAALVDGRTAAVQTTLKGLTPDFKPLETELTEALAAVNQDMDLLTKRLAELQESLSELAALSISERKADEQELERRLTGQRKAFQNHVDELTTLLNRNDDKIEALILRMNALQKDFSRLAAPSPPFQPKSTGVLPPGKSISEDTLQ